jgi:hypothetical protein
MVAPSWKSQKKSRLNPAGKPKPRNFDATPRTAVQANQHTFAAAQFASQAPSPWSNLQSGYSVVLSGALSTPSK